VKQAKTQSHTRQSRRRPALSENSKHTRQIDTRLMSEQVMAMIADYYDHHIAPHLEIASADSLGPSEQDIPNHDTGEIQ